MNSKRTCGLFKVLAFLPLLPVYTGLAIAQSASVLDPSQHPASPEFESVYPDNMLPLDTKLSWTERFNGDDSFNTSLLPTTAGADLEGDSTAINQTTETSSSNTPMDAQGEVKSIQVSQGKIKIKHGPIDKYGMPGMTMMFKVADPVMLEGLNKNQQIGFNVDNASGGFVLTQITPIAQMATSENKIVQQKMDARGVVQTIRVEQGKIKIKHGPIDKYGMPGMTMVFKVSDPALLGGLRKGSDIDFDIDNASGGFVITNIVPPNQITKVTSNSRSCYKIGPFKEKARAIKVNNRYAANQIKTKFESSSEKVYLGTMVYLSGYETRQEALKAAETLKRQGIQDYFIINESRGSILLSLGVFGLRENAESRIAEIEKLNYQVESKPRYRQQTSYWLHSQHSTETDSDSLLDPGDVDNGISRIPRQCA